MREDVRRESSLDLSPDALHELSSRAVALVRDYFENLSAMPVFPPIAGGEIKKRLGALPLEGEPVEQLFADSRAIIESSRQNGHPRFFAYVASPATPPGAFADLIASTLNATVTSWRSGPAATEIELIVVRWLGSLISYGENVHGLLTSGGSMANLLALLIALRSRSEGSPAHDGLWRNQTPQSIYASDQIHMSIPKAADILGIGRNQVRIVDTDDRFRIKTTNLRQRIKADLQGGLKPFCVVASAGTVNTGAVDPLKEVADVAREFGLWFHVDGAYGVPATLDPAKQSLFAGLELADSVSLDPHKWLYTPVDCGCLLFHDEAVARSAFSANEADYIKVHEQDDEESFAFWDYGMELSRRFRALKVWFTLKYYGARRLAEAIRDDNALARYLADTINDSEDFELLAPVELSICCFRYLPPSVRKSLPSASAAEGQRLNSSLDQLNARIMHDVQRGGRAYLSNATIRGRFALRVCITNFRTTRADIDFTLEVIRDAARRVGKDEG
jgi:glutamate/tyrosine decarboxylase-like PLP-dependent enzyme